MKLDHATIVTPDLPAARRFFCEVAGLTDGRRPPFRIGGHWLYADGRPVIHLVQATEPAAEGRTAPRIDHVAFRLDDPGQWRALVDRVRAHGLPAQIAQVPQSDEWQLFVALAPGVAVEFVIGLSAIAADGAE